MKVVCVTLHVVVILIIRYCLGDRIFSYSFWKLYAIYCQNNKWIKFPSSWWINMLHANSIFVKFWDAEAEPRLALSIPLSHDFIIFSLSRDGTDRTGCIYWFRVRQRCTNLAVDRCVTKTDVSNVNKNKQTNKNEKWITRKIKQTGNKL